MPLKDRFVILSEDCSLRNLETPFVFNKAEDELYELDTEAFEFLQSCDGSRRLEELDGNAGFIDYCFGEGILTTLTVPHLRYFKVDKSPAHSLRYLELHITDRCNLRCGHCYLAAGEGRDLELAKVFKVMDEFDRLQGLRLLISGGEPLMHRQFWYLNERLHDYGFRSILLSNGSMINMETAARLKVDEVQVSIDGMRGSHDRLRGDGTFDKAVQAVEHLQARGMRVSVATTVNALNGGEFNDLSMLVESLGVPEWNVDVASVTGRLKDNPGFAISPEAAAPLLSFGFCGSQHGGSDGFACGSHLCAVGARGQVAKCGFYLDRPVGHITDGLRECWERIHHTRLSELTCDCEFLDACRGGCRFRASNFTGEFGPDPVRCHNLGVTCKMQEGGDLHDHSKGCQEGV